MDFAAARHALQWAAGQAGGGGEVVAVHVLTPSMEFWRDLPPTGFTTWRGKLKGSLEGEWMDPLRTAGTKHEAVLVEDDSVDGALLRIGDERGAVMIVLGKHGHGDLTDRLMGSVTYKVAHRSSRPVMIIPADWTPEVP
ncbi:MAG: universal stress protein [Anaerolineaceae bacterium]